MQQWSVIIATRNRAGALAETLRRLPAPGGTVGEVIVVDNGSSDGSAVAAARAWTGAQVLRVRRNLGPAGKQLALERARFPLVAALDDDCAPAPWTWDEMARRFHAAPDMACAGWGVCLPDGGRECGALPRAFVGAAVAFRRGALLGAGGYSARLFMQAEEYDILFRLTAAGGRCEVFHDLPALHRKSALARSGRRTIYLDARNNLALIRRWAPREWGRMYAEDYGVRYAALGRLRGCAGEAMRGVRDGRSARWLGAGEPLASPVFDELFGITRIAREFGRLHAEGVRRVLLAPLGKNMLAFWRGARGAGIEIVAVADDRFLRAGIRQYRGVKVVGVDDAAAQPFDAVVISNSASVFAAQERDRWLRRVGVQVVAPDALDGGPSEAYQDAPAAA